MNHSLNPLSFLCKNQKNANHQFYLITLNDEIGLYPTSVIETIIKNSSFHTKIVSNNNKNDIIAELSSSLNQISDRINQGELTLNYIIIFCNKSQSFSTIMNFIQTMYQSQTLLTEQCRIPICGLFGKSYICVLPSGFTELIMNTGYEGEGCGIIPFGKPVKITTTGLKWNLDNNECQFGSLVSTSNELDSSGKVTIFANQLVTFTIGVQI